MHVCTHVERERLKGLERSLKVSMNRARSNREDSCNLSSRRCFVFKLRTCYLIPLFHQVANVFLIIPPFFFFFASSHVNQVHQAQLQVADAYPGDPSGRGDCDEQPDFGHVCHRARHVPRHPLRCGKEEKREKRVHTKK